MMKLASFDIFDTTLIRRCGKPENIFYMLAYRLYPDDVAKRENFLLWRIGAENRAMQRLSSSNVSLTDIYADCDSMFLDKHTHAELENLEMEIESENLTVNPSVLKIIHQRRANGFNVCFISDMYLSSSFLVKILKREKCLMENEFVYVSCECKARKSSGQLYEHIRSVLHPCEWVHYGDNRQSDVKMAHRNGIKSAWIDTGYTDAERRIISSAGLSKEKYVFSILAGFSRMARICTNGTSVSELAADFVAPSYIPYVLSIVKEARQKGIKRLYFLSRDSYILMKATQVLSPADMELRYLFVSRQSLFLPYMVDTNAEHYLEAIDGRTVYRKHIDSLLHKLGTDRKELAALNITFDYNHVATREDERDFLHKIFDGRFAPILHERAQKAYSLIIDYFAQEGLLDPTESAMIDIGWLGTSRLMMNYLLRRAGAKNGSEFFYYGVRNDVLPTEYGSYTAYFPAGQLSTEATAILENYFSASPYPTTVGYIRGEKCIEPEFPTGISFAETPITRTNVRIVEHLLPDIASMNFISDEIMRQWAVLSLDTLISLKYDLDLSPLCDCPDFDGKPFVRRLTLSELFATIIAQQKITALDRMSLYITCRKIFRYPVLALYDTIHGVKEYIYRKYIYKHI